MLERLLADRERLPHALLVHGPAGIGKVEFARALAAGLLCEAPRDGLACGACASCHWFSQGNHPDYRELIPEATAEDEADEAPAESGKPEKAKSVVDQDRPGARRGRFHRALDPPGRPSRAHHPSGRSDASRGGQCAPEDARGAAAAHPHRSRERPHRAAAADDPQPLPPASIAAAHSRPGTRVAQGGRRCRGRGGTRSRGRRAACSRATSRNRRKRHCASACCASSRSPRRRCAGVSRRRWIAHPSNASCTGCRRGSTTSCACALRAPRAITATWLPALQARARASDLEALFALDRELAEARRLAAHPLNARLLAEHLLMSYNRATTASRP